LILWGYYDPFFTVAGAEAYRRDLPDAELHLLEAGHFVLETHGELAASLITDFLDRRIPSRERAGSAGARTRALDSASA
jgi:pimeloyl-ACP methyl ester carboxylesterase